VNNVVRHTTMLTMGLLPTGLRPASINLTAVHVTCSTTKFSFSVKYTCIKLYCTNTVNIICIYLFDQLYNNIWGEHVKQLS